jgi:hypothetical protein
MPKKPADPNVILTLQIVKAPTNPNRDRLLQALTAHYHSRLHYVDFVYTCTQQERKLLNQLVGVSADTHLGDMTRVEVHSIGRDRGSEKRLVVHGLHMHYRVRVYYSPARGTGQIEFLKN